jgi:hypothetical protein
MLVILAFAPLLLPRGTCLCHLLHEAPEPGDSAPAEPSCCHAAPAQSRTPVRPVAPIDDRCPDDHCVHCKSLSDFTLVKPSLDAKKSPAPTPFPSQALAPYIHSFGPDLAVVTRGDHPSGPPLYLAFKSLRL